jgi:hypothetical protein
VYEPKLDILRANVEGSVRVTEDLRRETRGLRSGDKVGVVTIESRLLLLEGSAGKGVQESQKINQDGRLKSSYRKIKRVMRLPGWRGSQGREGCLYEWIRKVRSKGYH